MVTGRRNLNGLFFSLLAALLWLAGAATAQDNDVYRTAVKFKGGGQPIYGFLYAINDTAVVILPSNKLSRRGLKAALELAKPVSIPLDLVRKVKVVKQRSAAHDVTVGTLVSLGYAITYLILVPIQTPAGLVPYAIFVGGMSLITLDLMYAKNYKPTVEGFKIIMQKYCMKKDELMVDR